MSGTVAAEHDHAHAPHTAQAHGSLSTYMIGFGLSVVLTAIPFWLVMTHALHSKLATGIVIAALAVTQIVVHMICFLHMNAKVEEGWSILALVFTLILVLITLIGSLWIVYHLNANMTPTMDMGQMP